MNNTAEYRALEKRWLLSVGHYNDGRRYAYTITDRHTGVDLLTFRTYNQARRQLRQWFRHLSKSEIKKNILTDDAWRQRLIEKNAGVAATHPHMKAIEDKLLNLVPQSFLLWHPKLSENACSILLERAEYWPAPGILFEPGEPSSCHDNVGALYSEEKIDAMVTGFALSDDNLWRYHSWGLRGDKIIETTVKRLAYWGVVFTVPGD